MDVINSCYHRILTKKKTYTHISNCSRKKHAFWMDVQKKNAKVMSHKKKKKKKIIIIRSTGWIHRSKPKLKGDAFNVTHWFDRTLALLKLRTSLAIDFSCSVFECSNGSIFVYMLFFANYMAHNNMICHPCASEFMSCSFHIPLRILSHLRFQ